MNAEQIEKTKYYAALTIQTRKYGHCYVHSGKREKYVGLDGIVFLISGYGRSLQSRNGHKYKVHAIGKNGKPAASKDLVEICELK